MVCNRLPGRQRVSPSRPAADAIFASSGCSQPGHPSPELGLFLPRTRSVGIPATATAVTVERPAAGGTPQLWPKLSPFQTMVVANLAGGTSEQELAATTLEGAYNQLQGTNRLYVVWSSDDQTWLSDNVLTGVQWSPLAGQGAILINPSDPDTINLATTMAGIDDAMVADPSQLPLLRKYGIPVIHTFAHQAFASATAAYRWEFTHLFPQTNPADLVILNAGDYGSLRDYIIATRSFVFYLTSTDPAQKPLMNLIIRGRPTLRSSATSPTRDPTWPTSAHSGTS
jgi:GxGYxY motif-containing protein